MREKESFEKTMKDIFGVVDVAVGIFPLALDYTVHPTACKRRWCPILRGTVMEYQVGDRVSLGCVDGGDDISGTVTGERFGKVLVALDDYKTTDFEFDENKLKPAQVAICLWRQDNDGYWLTGCGDHPWQYEEGGPADNHQIFCHRCGGKVVVEA